MNGTDESVTDSWDNNADKWPQMGSKRPQRRSTAGQNQRSLNV